MTLTKIKDDEEVRLAGSFAMPFQPTGKRSLFPSLRALTFCRTKIRLQVTFARPSGLRLSVDGQIISEVEAVQEDSSDDEGAFYLSEN